MKIIEIKNQQALKQFSRNDIIKLLKESGRSHPLEIRKCLTNEWANGLLSEIGKSLQINIAIENGKPVGMITLRKPGKMITDFEPSIKHPFLITKMSKNPYIGDLVVSEKAQSRGLGSLLVNSLPHKTTYVNTGGTVVKFYKKLGFDVVGKLKYKSFNVKEPAIILRRRK